MRPKSTLVTLSFPSLLSGFCGRIYSLCSDQELGGNEDIVDREGMSQKQLPVDGMVRGTVPLVHGEACCLEVVEPSASQAEDGLPLEDYDSLNVNQITGKMKELSVEEIRRLRDYEVRNKNRRTLMSRFNQRIEATL